MRLVDGYGISIYPVTSNLVDWMINTLNPVEASAFHFWRSRIGLVRMAEKVHDKRLHPYAIDSALQQHFEDLGEVLTYEECLSLTADNVFSPEGEWVVYTNRPREFILGDYNDVSDAIYNAEPEIDWLLLWMPFDNELLVFRSPYEGRRQYAGEYSCMGKEAGDYVDGLERREGPQQLAYVLPPDIEGAIIQDLTSDRTELSAFGD